MRVDKNPCTSCPYRRDCPSGVWSAEDYFKLVKYDRNEEFAVFLCHQTELAGEEIVCRGWLTVQIDSVAARLAVLRGMLTDAQRCAKVTVPLYKTGLAAAEAGLRAINRPGKAAKKIINRLLGQSTRIRELADQPPSPHATQYSGAARGKRRRDKSE